MCVQRILMYTTQDYHIMWEIPCLAPWLNVSLFNEYSVFAYLIHSITQHTPVWNLLAMVMTEIGGSIDGYCSWALHLTLTELHIPLLYLHTVTTPLLSLMEFLQI